MTTWYREHRSAILIFFVFSLGFVLVILSNLNGYIDKLPVLRQILSSIGGTFIAGGIATLFLNLPNTRKFLSNTIANLFATGQVVNLLSQDHKSLLKKNIICYEIGIPEENLDESLYNKINSIQYNCHKDFHLHNYIVDFSIIDSKKYSGYIEEEQYISYRVISSHLKKNEKKPFKLVTVYQVPYLGDGILTKEDFIQRFEVKIGDEFFDKRHLEILEIEKGSINYHRYKFVYEVEVQDILDIEIKVGLVKTLIDKSYSLYARYPIKAYSAKLSYKDEFKYECNWFRYWDGKADILDSILDGKEFTNGISVISRDWLLPGEGVVLEFH